MRIGIFANPIIQEKAGVGRCAYNLVLEILRQDKNNEYFLWGNFFRKYHQSQRELENFVALSGNQKTQIIITRYPDAFRDWLFGINFPIKWLFRAPIDLYFALFPAHIAKNGYPKQISLIYDFVFDKFPETQGKKFSRYYRVRTQNAATNCQKLFCISRETEKDLIKLYPICFGKTEIIFLACDKKIFYPKKADECKQAQNKYHITKPYLMACGTLEPRKNLETLLDAFLLLPFSLQKNLQLVLVGKPGWLNQGLLRKINDIPAQKDKFIRTGFVSDIDLANLYSGAAAFVFPSLYEGFGMPPLEAYSCGTPVISSNASSLPEVIGDAGILVNPKSAEDLKEAIKKLLSDNELRRNLIKNGFQQAKKFSWSKEAQKVIKVLRRMD